MNWGTIFGKTVLDRGRKYYDAGKVKNLKYEDGSYQATVRGSLPYHVQIGVSGNTIRSMECSCPYASEGHRCKHMAAVLIAIERQRAQAKLRESMGLPAAADPEECETYNPDDMEIPFPENASGEQEYAYFDLARMTEDMTFTAGICRMAKRMIADKRAELQEVQLGYSHVFSGKETLGTARGVISSGGRSYPVSLTFDRSQIREASCHVTGCSRHYSNNPYLRVYYNGENSPQLCAHQMALLYLLADYIQEYNPGDSTDYEGAQLLQRFRSQRGAGIASVQPVPDMVIHLEPRLERTREGLKASFRIGADRPYLVKNLTELVEKAESGAVMEFGARLKVDFSHSHFAEDSRGFYEWIETAVKEENQRTERNRAAGRYENRPVEIKGSLDVYGARLDTLFALIGDRAVEYTDAFRPRTVRSELRMQDKAPVLEMQVVQDLDERGLFQGIRVQGRLPQLWEGVRYYYYLEEPYLNRIQPEQVQELLPLYQMGNGENFSFQVGRKHLAEFYYSIMPILRRYGTITEVNAEQIEVYLPPEARFLFYLDAEDRNITCRADVYYGEQRVSLMDHVKNGFAGVKELFRDSSREKAVLSQVMTYFPQTDADRELFHCGGEEEAVYEVLEHGVDQLLSMGEVHTTDAFRHLNIRRRPKISIGVSVESDIMNLDISSEDISREELMDILRSYRKKKKFYRLKNGDFLNMEEENLELLNQLMEDLHVSPREFVKGKMQLPIYRALYLDQMLGQSEALYSTRDSRFKKLVKEFKTVKDSDYELPDHLRRIMRKYQITGYRWLRTLAAYGFGGILADDMGLGKTLQMISVLAAHKAEGGTGTSLIITPASLVFNWQEEFHRYAPELKVCLMVGTQSERILKLREYKQYDVLVTSYDLLKRDIAEYEDCQFCYQVLDEAQYIKNHATAASKAVKIIHSRTRYALTGTPIENRLSELWSIFDYLMPGFLYGYDTFKKEMETPITKNKDEAATARLKKMVSPFILRRLKQDVLKDLPDKLEEIRYARLETEQQRLYDAQVLHMRDVLREQSAESFQKNRMQILAELTKIRQICCDPSLFLEDYAGGSAKREACLDLIRSAMEGEHKMLVFSQFTSMLELLEEDLRKAGISYYKITGSTPKETRVQLVRSFNTDDTPVFLISLKAGGTGLNLTGADVVIHYDPWWNLAVQNQATDRAHRIGQTRVVSVYKLIAKDSIEEKILHMQETKKNLADEILSGESGGLASLTREELLELIQG